MNKINNYKPKIGKKWIETGTYITCPYCNDYFNMWDDSGDLQKFIYCPTCGRKIIEEES